MIWLDAKVRGGTGASCRRRKSLNVLCDFQLSNWYIRKKSLWEENLVRSIPPLVLILSQLILVRTLSSHFLDIHFNINLPCKPRSSKWVLSFGFPHLSPVFLFYVRATCPAQLILLDFGNNWWVVQIISLVHLVQFASFRWLHVPCSAARVQRCRVRCLQTMPPGQQDSRHPAGRPVCRPDHTLHYQLNLLVSSKEHTILSPAREVTDVPGCGHPGWFESQSLPAKLGVDEATYRTLWSGVLSVDRELPQ